MNRCALCGDALDRDSPWSIYARNPLTFRMAWMHGSCATDALECLRGKPSRIAEYRDQYDEYIYRFDD